jgi:hypothetical protein
MRTKIARAIVVFALVCAIGGHWAILQSVAWVNMVVDFSQTSTLGSAITKTFDGKHPCALCKAVQEGKASEGNQTSLKVETKLDFWLASASLLLEPPLPFVVLPGKSSTPLLRPETPPTPPPRLV